MNDKLKHERAELWSKFAKSGRISDYLNYCRLTSTETNLNEEQ